MCVEISVSGDSTEDTLEVPLIQENIDAGRMETVALRCANADYPNKE